MINPSEIIRGQKQWGSIFKVVKLKVTVNQVSYSQQNYLLKNEGKVNTLEAK